MGRLGVWGLALVVSSLSFASKTEREYWNDLGVPFASAERALSTEVCHQNEMAFVGCMLGFTAALQTSTDLVLAPKELVQNEKDFGEVAAEFDQIVAVGAKRIQAKSVVEGYQKDRAEKRAMAAAWKAHYQKVKSHPLSFTAIYQYIRSLPDFDKNESFITGEAINGYMAVIRDPHTGYSPTAWLDEQMKATGDSWVGVGAKLRNIRSAGANKIVVLSPIEGGPAHKAGLRAGDVITAIDGKPFDGTFFERAVKTLRGEAGTTVRVTVERKGESLDIDILRERIHIPNVSSKILGTGKNRTGYIRYESFMSQSGCSDIEKAVLSFEQEKVQGIVLDLRDNGGGLVSQAVCIGGIFLPYGSTVLISKALPEGREVNHYRTKTPQVSKLPLVTLINSYSASASEILAGAFQDYGRSVLVGDRTYGKATIQGMDADEDTPGLTLRSTIARFYQPSGRTNQIVGISPDIQIFSVPKPTEEDKFALREEDEYMALPPLGDGWKQPRTSDINTLNDCRTQKGAATARFEGGQSDALAPDYQLFEAEDTLRCMVETGAGLKSLEVTPALEAIPHGPETQPSVNPLKNFRDLL